MLMLRDGLQLPELAIVFFKYMPCPFSLAQQLTAVRCACACGVCGVQDKAVLYGISSYNINKDTYL